MGEYVSLYRPGEALPVTASAAITGGQLVKVTGPFTVGPTTAAGADWVGVATNDAAVGEMVTVVSGGVEELTASGAIAAGAEVIPAAAGAVATIGAGSVNHRVGLALQAAASGKVFVKLDR